MVEEKTFKPDTTAEKAQQDDLEAELQSFVNELNAMREKEAAKIEEEIDSFTIKPRQAGKYREIQKLGIQQKYDLALRLKKEELAERAEQNAATITPEPPAETAIDQGPQSEPLPTQSEPAPETEPEPTLSAPEPSSERQTDPEPTVRPEEQATKPLLSPEQQRVQKEINAKILRINQTDQEIFRVFAQDPDMAFLDSTYGASSDNTSRKRAMTKLDNYIKAIDFNKNVAILDKNTREFYARFKGPDTNPLILLGLSNQEIADATIATIKKKHAQLLGQFHTDPVSAIAPVWSVLPREVVDILDGEQRRNSNHTAQESHAEQMRLAGEIIQYVNMAKDSLNDDAKLSLQKQRLIRQQRDEQDRIRRAEDARKQAESQAARNAQEQARRRQQSAESPPRRETPPQAEKKNDSQGKDVWETRVPEQMRRAIALELRLTQSLDEIVTILNKILRTYPDLKNFRDSTGAILNLSEIANSTINEIKSALRNRKYKTADSIAQQITIKTTNTMYLQVREKIHAIIERETKQAVFEAKNTLTYTPSFSVDDAIIQIEIIAENGVNTGITSDSTNYSDILKGLRSFKQHARTLINSQASISDRIDALKSNINYVTRNLGLREKIWTHYRNLLIQTAEKEQHSGSPKPFAEKVRNFFGASDYTKAVRLPIKSSDAH